MLAVRLRTSGASKNIFLKTANLIFLFYFRLQPIIRKKERKKKTFYLQLVAHFLAMKSQKLTKKAKKIYLADFGQQYQQKIEKKRRKNQSWPPPYGWRSLKNKQHQNLALNSLNVQASQQCLAPSASKSNIISYNHQNTCRLRMD